jgi:chemotaxis protein methyltransferase CheR
VPAATARVREFTFSDGDFRALRTMVKEMTGIHLTDSRRELVYGRVSRRVRALGLKSFREYRRLLAADNAAEMSEFCNALTTNLTYFFRESHHFDYLRDSFLSSCRNDAGRSRRIRIWSSACSTGEEPYSMAMTIVEALPAWKRWDIKILATDLDSDVLARAKRGTYTRDQVKEIDSKRLARFFIARGSGNAAVYKVIPELANLVTFKQVNLMHELPMSGPLDVIFCRNVVIYFDKDTQRGLFSRIADLQRPGDLLLVGHSESLLSVSNDYALVGQTIYRRK